MLETTRAKISFLETMANKLRSAPKVTQRYGSDGKMEIVPNTVLADQEAVLLKLDTENKFKNDLEDKLADSNAKVQVDFPDEKIKEML
jgi:hypothetical protein